MLRSKSSVGVAVLVAACAALIPAPAGAAKKKPTTSVATGGVTAVQPTAAKARGAVRPRGVATTYSFQYGTTREYEATTAEFDAGDGGKLRKVSADLLNLAPATRYHYRIVARNARGVFRGKDRTFKTRKQPLGLVLNPDANPVSIDQLLTLTGQLSGTDNRNRRIALQYKPFPYMGDWAAVPGINDVVTPEGGYFAFRLPAIAFNTQFRVAVAGKPDVVSPIVSVGVMPRVSTDVPARVTRKRGKRARITWRGTVTPNRDGAQVLIQKRARGAWRTIGATVAVRASDTTSRYRKTVRQRRGGTYRVVVDSVDGAFAPGNGREKRIRVRTRR